MEITCKKCGTKYKLIEQSYPMRDKDSLSCKFCESKVFSWNGGVICSIELISHPTNSEYIKGEIK